MPIVLFGEWKWLFKTYAFLKDYRYDNFLFLTFVMSGRFGCNICLYIVKKNNLYFICQCQIHIVKLAFPTLKIKLYKITLDCKKKKKIYVQAIFVWN